MPIASGEQAGRHEDAPENGVRLDFVRLGDGETVLVVLHPVGLDRNAWAPLAGRLAERHTVIAPSLRGHGLSPFPQGPWTIGDLADDVHALIRRAEVGRAHIVGLSLGGILAQQVALEHPDDIHSLVLIATTAGFDPSVRELLRDRGRRALDGGMSAIVDESLARWFAPSARDGALASQVRRRLLASDPRAWAMTWNAMADFDALGRLAQVPHRSLVLGGSEDASTPATVSAALADELPNAHLVVVPGAGHFAALEHPERYARLIAEFVGLPSEPKS